MKYSTPLAETPKKALNLVDLSCSGDSICVLLDTGAVQSWMKAKTANRLGLTIKDDKAIIPKIQLGPFEWHDFTVCIDQSEDISQKTHGRSTDGIFGTDLMNGLCWLYDRPSRVMHVTTPEESFVEEWSSGANKLSIRRHKLGSFPGNVWATDSYLNGHGPIHTDLDTGAQRTILTSKTEPFLDPNASREEIKLSSGSLSNVSSYRCHVKELQIAGVTFENPLVAVADPIFEIAPELLQIPAILLGIDVFGENRYGFDLLNGTFWLHP